MRIKQYRLQSQSAGKNLNHRAIKGNYLSGELIFQFQYMNNKKCWLSAMTLSASRPSLCSSNIDYILWHGDTNMLAANVNIALTAPGYCRSRFMYVGISSIHQLPVKYRQALSRFRCASHTLNVELGRQNKIPFEQRICQFCFVFKMIMLV